MFTALRFTEFLAKLICLRQKSEYTCKSAKIITVKILKIGTPEIITIIVLQLEQLDYTVQYCVQKMQTEQQTEKTLIRLLHEEQSDLGLHCLLRPICPNI